jgi:hypothetical protein
MKIKDQIIFVLAVVVCLISLTGCVNQTPPTPTATSVPATAATTTEPVMPAATELIASVNTEEPTPPVEVADTQADIRYQLDVSLDYAGHTMTITQTIDYTNSTETSLSEVPLILPPIRTADGFSLLNFQMGTGYEASTYDFQNEILWLTVSPALEAGQRLSLNLLYKLEIPESQTAFGYTDRQMLLSDWYAFIPPYLPGEGWLINQPGYVGEYLAYPLADFTVNVRLSPPMDSLVVAASAPLQSLDGNCWRYSAQQVRNFSLAISPEYQVFSAGTDQVTIYAYLFPEHAALGARAASIALEAWVLYSELYGDNPRQFMSIIEADLTDGLECDGLFYLSESYFASADETPQNYFHLLVAHETAHQWFYGLVPNDQAFEPWLDESLAAYSELLYLERYYPDLVDWWWGFRVRAFGPTGAVNSIIYDFLTSRPYINAVYLRGVTFQQALRDAVGDEAYFTALKRYADSSQGDTFRDADSFFDAFHQVTDIDFTQLTAIYFK